MDNILNILGHGRDVTDQVIATDLLVSVKSTIITTSKALSETRDTVLHEALKLQLNDAMDQHERVFSYMMKKGYYHPQNIAKQKEVLFETAETALTIAKD